MDDEEREAYEPGSHYEAVAGMLASLDFIDRTENSTFFFDMSKNFGELGDLAVFDDDGSDMMELCWYKSEQEIDIVLTNDITLLESAVRHTLAYFDVIASLQQKITH